MDFEKFINEGGAGERKTERICAVSVVCEKMKAKGESTECLLSDSIFFIGTLVEYPPTVFGQY